MTSDVHERAVVNKTGHEATATDRALTGIRGLDDVLYGGFPRFARDDIGRIRRGHRLANRIGLIWPKSTTRGGQQPQNSSPQ